MTRFGWHSVIGAGIGLVLLGAAPARAEEGKAGSKSETTPSTEGAKGSGMGGASTGARPGEVSGATPAGEASAAAGSPKGNQISGKIERYDRESRTLSLVNSDKKLKLSDDTEVVKDGSKVSPGQIMEGDEVRASYSGSGDTVEAQRIEVKSGGGGR